MAVHEIQVLKLQILLYSFTRFVKIHLVFLKSFKQS